MGLNRPITKTLFVKNGAVKTTGGNVHLADGQLGIVDLLQGTPSGAAVVNSFAGAAKDMKRFAIQLGVVGEVSRSTTNKPFSTGAFALANLKKLRASAPQTTEISLDDLIIGYDNFDASKALNFKKGQHFWNISLHLKNAGIQYRGGATCDELINVKIEIPACDHMNDCEDCDECENVDCREIVLRAIDRLKNSQLSGGQKVSEFVDITPVLGECDVNPNPSLIGHTFYKLEVCDTGDAEALAAIQAQYNFPIQRVDRKGAISVYQVLLPTGDGAPDDYEQVMSSILKGCDSCPDGWITEPGGILYAITIADGGVDRSSIITTNLANAKYVADSITKQGDDNGVGFYTALYSSAITAAEISSFVGSAANNRNTATVQVVGTVQSFCNPDDSEEFEWVEGDECNATSETYSIVLPDNDCGETRLAELQSAYPDLTIAVAMNPDLRTRTITLTGNAGTANITVGGVDYLATYGTSLTATAAAFVTSHAAAILGAADVVVTANAGVLTFVGPTATINALAITNATTNLDGTLGTALMNIPHRQGCSTRYQTTVISNIVCDECDPGFLDVYLTKAPRPFNNEAWTKVSADVNRNTNCLCGIRFRSKYFVLSGDEALRDIVSFTESATEIQVSSGYPEEIREGIGFIPKSVDAVTRRSRYVPRTHLYGNIRAIENESRAFFKGTNYQPNYLTRLLLGETAAVQNNLSQYVSYYVQLGHDNFAGGFGDKAQRNVEYEIVVELGKHYAVQNLLNSLAGAAGVPGVTV
jgi:hypothetical protein